MTAEPTRPRAPSFLDALFDFPFTYFVTSGAVKVIYALCILLSALAVFIGDLALLASGPARFGIVPTIIMIALSPIAFLFLVTLYRLGLELDIVLFRMAEHLRDISAQNELLLQAVSPRRRQYSGERPAGRVRPPASGRPANETSTEVHTTVVVRGMRGYAQALRIQRAVEAAEGVVRARSTALERGTLELDVERVADVDFAAVIAAEVASEVIVEESSPERVVIAIAGH